MGRQPNDGRGRLGGRAKGTPNKVTTLSVQELQAVTLSENRRKFKEAMKKSESDNALIAYAILSLAEAIRNNTEAFINFATERAERGTL